MRDLADADDHGRTRMNEEWYDGRSSCGRECPGRRQGMITGRLTNIIFLDLNTTLMSLGGEIGAVFICQWRYYRG